MSDQHFRAEIAQHPAIGSEPRDGYVLGRIHPHRLRLTSLKTEARVLIRALGRRGTPRKLLIFGRPRSGTTLLRLLLNQVPQIRCDGELLHDVVIAPRRYLNLLARRSEAAVYGVKLLSYQMLEVQKISDPYGFMQGLAEDGFRFVHLRRHTLPQTLSLAAAQQSGRYFNRDGQSGPVEIALDEARFMAHLRWNAQMLDFEDQLMSHFDAIRLQYEDDLEQAGQHQPTIDRVCAQMGVASVPVAAQIARTGGAQGTVQIANRDALIAAANRSDLAPMLAR